MLLVFKSVSHAWTRNIEWLRGTTAETSKWRAYVLNTASGLNVESKLSVGLWVFQNSPSIYIPFLFFPFVRPIGQLVAASQIKGEQRVPMKMFLHDERS